MPRSSDPLDPPPPPPGYGPAFWILFCPPPPSNSWTLPCPHTFRQVEFLIWTDLLLRIFPHPDMIGYLNLSKFIEDPDTIFFTLVHFLQLDPKLRPWGPEALRPYICTVKCFHWPIPRCASIISSHYSNLHQSIRCASTPSFYHTDLNILTVVTLFNVKHKCNYPDVHF